MNVGEKEAMGISEEEARERESAQCAKERIKKLLDPRSPSREDIEEHMLTHLPSRNLCELRERKGARDGPSEEGVKA